MKRRIRWVSTRRRLPAHGLHFGAGTYLFLLAAALIGLTAVDTDANLLIIVLGLCVGALVATGFAGWISLRNLAVTRFIPDGVMAGQRFVIRYQVTNQQRWASAYSLHLVDVVDSAGAMPPPEAFIPVLRPGETITLRVPAVCPRRGRIQFDRIGLGTGFPFGLFTKFATASLPETLIVFPALGSVREQRWLASRWADEDAGGAPLLHRGDDEFMGLREYRAGDNPRRIHWRRSARSGTLVVREMSQLRANQLWCVLDTRVPAGDAHLAARLEEAISCAATVACDAIESNCKVGVICNGDPLLVLPPAGGRDYRLRILRELALRPPNSADRLSLRLARLNWPSRWRGPCLLFAGKANDDLPESARLLAGRLGSTAIYLPGTPAFEAIYSVLRGSRRRARGAVSVRSGGAVVAPRRGTAV